MITSRWRYVIVGGVAAAVALGAACSKKPVAAKDEFTLVADSLGDVPMHPDALKTDNLALAHDGSLETRWTTVANMEPGFFVEIDYPRDRDVAGLTLDASPSPNDFPRSFVVEACSETGDWVEVATGGAGATVKGVTTIKFKKPVKARRILISVNKPAPYWWSIYEIHADYAGK